MAKILIADDSNSLRNMMQMTLQTKGHQVTAADNGGCALELAQNTAFDLVITDLNMPFLNGLELVEVLRNQPEYKYTPMIMLTTESSDERKAFGRSIGVTGWIVKPFSPQKILDAVNRVL